AGVDLDRRDVRARPDRAACAPRRAAADGGGRCRAPPAERALRQEGDHEAPLQRLLDPIALDDPPDADRRAGADRGAGLRTPRPGPPRPAGSTAGPPRWRAP